MVESKEKKLLLVKEDFKPSHPEFEVLGVLNPAAVRVDDGNIFLYVRVIEKLKETVKGNYFLSPRCVGKNKYKIKIDKFHRKKIVDHSDLDILFRKDVKRLTFISHLRRVVLDKDGFKINSIDKEPSFFGLSWDGELGIEDPRIVKIGDLYIMTYVSLSRTGNISTSLAISNDCKRWYRRGIIFKEQNKDVVLFPELIHGKYVAINRPEGSFSFTSPHMWISYSKDLDFWGKSYPLILSKRGWDSGRIGAGPPPLKLDNGWLLIYHGVITKMRKEEIPLFEKIKRILRRERLYNKIPIDYYVVGAVFLDLKNPRKKLRRSHKPILYPTKEFSRDSFEAKEIVFPTGIVRDNDDILLYSGEGDVSVSVRKISIKNILKETERVN